MRNRVFQLFAVGSFALLALYACDRQATTPTDETNPSLARQTRETGDPAVLAMMHAANKRLAAQGVNYRLEASSF